MDKWMDGCMGGWIGESVDISMEQEEKEELSFDSQPRPPPPHPSHLQVPPLLKQADAIVTPWMRRANAQYNFELQAAATQPYATRVAAAAKVLPAVTAEQERDGLSFYDAQFSAELERSVLALANQFLFPYLLGKGLDIDLRPLHLDFSLGDDGLTTTNISLTHVKATFPNAINSLRLAETFPGPPGASAAAAAAASTTAKPATTTTTTANAAQLAAVLAGKASNFTLRTSVAMGEEKTPGDISLLLNGTVALGPGKWVKKGKGVDVEEVAVELSIDRLSLDVLTTVAVDMSRLKRLNVARLIAPAAPGSLPSSPGAFFSPSMPSPSSSSASSPSSSGPAKEREEEVKRRLSALDLSSLVSSLGTGSKHGKNKAAGSATDILSTLGPCLLASLETVTSVPVLDLGVSGLSVPRFTGFSGVDALYNLLVETALSGAALPPATLEALLRGAVGVSLVGSFKRLLDVILCTAQHTLTQLLNTQHR